MTINLLFYDYERVHGDALRVQPPAQGARLDLPHPLGCPDAPCAVFAYGCRTVRAYEQGLYIIILTNTT